MKNPVLIGEIIKKIIRTYHLEKPLRQQRSVFLWNEIIDNNIKKHTKAVSFKDGKLFVEVESSTLRNELLFKKMQYINELNNKIGERAVENIVFINRRAQ